MRFRKLETDESGRESMKNMPTATQRVRILAMAALLSAVWAGPGNAEHRIRDASECSASPNVECVMSMATEAVRNVENGVTRRKLRTDLARRYGDEGKLYEGMAIGKRVDGGNWDPSVIGAVRKGLEHYVRGQRNRWGTQVSNPLDSIDYGALSEMVHNAFFQSCGAVVEGRFGDAREHATSVRKTRDRVEILHYIAAEQIRTGHLEAAGHTLDEAITVTRSAGTKGWTLQALLDSARLQIKAGDRDAAQTTLDTTLSTQYAHKKWNNAELKGIMVPGMRKFSLEWVRRHKAGERLGADIRFVNPTAGVATVQAEAGWLAQALASARLGSSALERAFAHRSVAKVELEGGRAESAAQVLESARVIAETIEDAQIRVKVLQEIAATQIEAGTVNAAAETFAAALESVVAIAPDRDRVLIMREIAEQRARAGQHEEARATAASIESNAERAWTYLSLAGIATKEGNMGNTGEALKMAIEEASTGGRAEKWLWHEISKVQIALGKFTEALASAQKIERTEVQVQTLLEIADALLNADQTELAEQVIATATTATRRIQDEKRREWQGVLIANRQLRNKQFSAALATIRAQTDARNRFDALLAVARAQIAHGQIEEGKEIIAEAMEAVTTVQQARRLRVTYFYDLRDEAGAYFAEGETEKGRAILGLKRALVDAIRKPGDHALALKRLGAELVRMRRVEEAAETFDAAVDAAKGVENRAQRRWLLRGITETQVELGLGANAIRELRMVGAGVEYGLIWISTALAQVGDYEAAASAARAIEDKANRAQAYRGVFEHQLAAGEFERAIRTANKTQFPRLAVEWMLWIEFAATKAGDGENAKKARAAAEAVAQGSENAREWAASLLKRMDARIREWESGKGRGGPGPARRKIREHLMKTAQYGAAVKAARNIEDLVERGQAMYKISVTQTRRGLFESAWVEARSTNNATERAWLLLGIGSGRDWTKQAQTRRAITDKAIEAANNIEDAYARAATLVRIASMHIQHGQQREALKTIEAAGEATKAIGNAEKRAETVAKIAVQQATAGQFEKAMDTANGINDPEARTRIRLKIAKVGARAGETEKTAQALQAASRSAKSIEDPDQHAHVSGEIALAHAREGQLTVATKRAAGIKSAAVRAWTLIRVSKYVPSREKQRWVVRCEAR